MKHINYDEMRRSAPIPSPGDRYGDVVVHKANYALDTPRLSIVLLDWNCRERFEALGWLAKQTVPRDQYELIWVELYDRVVPEVMEGADVLICCNQKGVYHKHVGYNIGMLQARGELITICDSDAVFPRDFVESVFLQFYTEGRAEPRPLVLMHYEGRSWLEYPDGLADVEDLKRTDEWIWWGLHPNVGACMTVRLVDAVRYGGFDEHESYRGYLCGPYDLGWRLVNAGIAEYWHPPSTMLWHFAHPDPIGVQGILPSLSHLREMTHAHVDLHAWTAVEAFSAGRMLPHQENMMVFRRRMRTRSIGSEFESRYADWCGPAGFCWSVRVWQSVLLFFDITAEAAAKAMRALMAGARRRLAVQVPRDGGTSLGRGVLGAGRTVKKVVHSYIDYNIIIIDGRLAAIPKNLGKYDVDSKGAMLHPDIVWGDSIFELRAALEQRPPPRTVHPVLYRENYRGTGYNIILADGAVFARPRPAGPFALDDRNIRCETVGEMLAVLDQKSGG